LKSLIADLSILAGALIIPAGIYEIYKPAGYIAMGIMMLVIGALLHYSTAKNSKQ
jgi:hypothetical protein